MMTRNLKPHYQLMSPDEAEHLLECMLDASHEFERLQGILCLALQRSSAVLKRKNSEVLERRRGNQVHRLTT
jgi:hypothetical protein